MIQLKATCKRCEGTGYDPGDTSSSGHSPGDTSSSGYPPLLCPDCEGKGILILDDRNWDISLERVPPFSLEEMEEMRKK